MKRCNGIYKAVVEDLRETLEDGVFMPDLAALVGGVLLCGCDLLVGGLWLEGYL